MGHARQSDRNITAILATLSRPCTRLSWTTLLDRRMDVLASRSWSIARPRKREAASIYGRHHAADALWDTDCKSGSGRSVAFQAFDAAAPAPACQIESRALRRRSPMATKKQRVQFLLPSPAVAEGLPPGAWVQIGSRKIGTDGAPCSAVLAAPLSVSRQR